VGGAEPNQPPTATEVNKAKQPQLLFKIFQEQEMERIFTTYNTLNLKGK
jgi:hypothetical protein